LVIINLFYRAVCIQIAAFLIIRCFCRPHCEADTFGKLDRKEKGVERKAGRVCLTDLNTLEDRQRSWPAGEKKFTMCRNARIVETESSEKTIKIYKSPLTLVWCQAIVVDSVG
jgi:hypothetical protein